MTSFINRAGLAALMLYCVHIFSFSAFGDESLNCNNDYVKMLGEIHKVPRINAYRAKRFTELLQAAGCPESDIEVYRVPELKRGGNICATLKGRRHPGELIVIGCHTDTQKNSLGVVDNWSSCVMQATLYKRLSEIGTDRTFLFVGFAGEEHGQYGSREFVHFLGRKYPGQVRAMINLECLGVGVLRTWANCSADDLEMIFRASSDAVDVPAETQILFGFKSDANSFMRAGIPSVTIHSLDGPHLAQINNELDDGSNVDFSRYCASFKQLSEFLQRLDSYDGTIRLADTDSDLRPVRSRLQADASQSERKEEGAIILSKLPRSSIEYQSGLRAGDILTEIDGVKLSRPIELRPTLLTLYRGKDVNVSVLRNGNNGTDKLEFTLAY